MVNLRMNVDEEVWKKCICKRMHKRWEEKYGRMV